MVYDKRQLQSTPFRRTFCTMHHLPIITHLITVSVHFYTATASIVLSRTCWTISRHETVEVSLYWLNIGLAWRHGQPCCCTIIRRCTQLTTGNIYEEKRGKRIKSSTRRLCGDKRMVIYLEAVAPGRRQLHWGVFLVQQVTFIRMSRENYWERRNGEKRKSVYSSTKFM